MRCFPPCAVWHHWSKLPHAPDPVLLDSSSHHRPPIDGCLWQVRPCSVFPNNHRRATDHLCSPSPVPLSRLDTFPKSIHTRPDVPRLVIHDTDTTRMTTNRIVIVRDRKSLLPTKRPHFIQKLPHTNNVHSCYPDHIVLRFDCEETVACCLINNEKLRRHPS